MPGYVLALGRCLCCQRLFEFNPHKVPSCSAVTGEREPICRNCISRANAKRAELGMPPLWVHPAAYEPLDEEDL